MLNFFKRTTSKTKLMANLNKALVYRDNPEELENCYQEFYNFIINDDVLGPIMKKHNCSLENMKELMTWLEATGYQIYKNQYIPTFAFSFAKPLEFFLTETEKGTDIAMIGYELKQMV